jgi:hypothetical protein
MRWGRILAVVLISVRSVAAQQAPGALSMVNNQYQWQQGAADLAEASSYVYRAYVDTMPVILAHACQATAQPMIFACAASIGPQLVGAHSAQLTAANQAGESEKSTPPLLYSVAIVPPAPQDPRLGPKPPTRPATRQRRSGQASAMPRTPAKTVAISAGQVATCDVAVSGSCGTVAQQPPVIYPGDAAYFLWTQAGPSVDVLNNEWFARAYLDQQAPVYLWAICTPQAVAGLFDCSGPVPPLEVGTHTATLTMAADVTGTTGGAVESLHSIPLVFVVSLGSPIPVTPAQVHLGSTEQP